MPFVGTGGGTVASSQIIDGTIVNADINASAAIDSSKLSNLPYQKLATASLGAGATTLSSGTFTARKFLRFIIQVAGNAAADLGIQFNGDTAANYEWVQTKDGGASTNNTADTKIKFGAGSETEDRLIVIDIINVAASAKQITGLQSTGHEITSIGGQWSNTSNQITSALLLLDAAGDITAGTEITVFGHD